MKTQQRRGGRSQNALLVLPLLFVFTSCSSDRGHTPPVYHVNMGSDLAKHENGNPPGKQAPVDTSRNQTSNIPASLSSQATDLLRQLPLSPGDVATLWFENVSTPRGLVSSPSKVEIRKAANERPLLSLQNPAVQSVTNVPAPNAVSLSSPPNDSAMSQAAAIPSGIRASSNGSFEYYLKIIGQSLGIFVAMITLYLLAQGKLKPTISNAAIWLRKNGSD